MLGAENLVRRTGKETYYRVKRDLLKGLLERCLEQNFSRVRRTGQESSELGALGRESSSTAANFDVTFGIRDHAQTAWPARRSKRDLLQRQKRPTIEGGAGKDCAHVDSLWHVT
jgi:hypothetical protein